MLQIAEPFRETFARLGLNSSEAVARFFLAENPPKSVVVKQATLSGAQPTSVFYKQYEYRPASWKFIGRASKARREFQNYAAFAKLGIACAEPIACGEERDEIGRLRRAFIITREIPNAKTLVEFFQSDCRDRKKMEVRKLRKQLIEQLAGIARHLHNANFFHHDFVWRNILVTSSPATGAKLWLIDCPRGKFDSWSPLRQRRRLKDLASLDKVASQLCTRGERLLFLKIYLAKPRLDSEAKRLAGQIQDYRKNRWPEDWKSGAGGGNRTLV